jgi:hypothetical protein
MELLQNLHSKKMPVFLTWLFFFFFDGTGVWTQGFICARQVLYHFGHASSPFCSGYFGDRVSLFAQTNLDLNLPIWHLPHSWMTGTGCHAQLFCIKMGLLNFWPRLAWNCSSPDLSLSRSLGWQAHAFAPRYWFRWGLVNILLRMALNHHPPNFRLLSS